ncbi:MAG: RDD family protein [Lentisphaerae bacterium]|nr:MAG: RDD family protein [Lentisphaerota bacterium]
MRYYILKDNNTEEGPIEQEVLVRMIQMGQVKADTKVRNAFSPNWIEAKKLSVFEEAARRAELDADSIEDLEEEEEEVYDPQESLNQVGRTRFVSARPVQRMMAWVFDMIITVGPAFVVLALLSMLEEEMTKDMRYFLATFVLSVTPWWFLLYFTVGLGFKAQTVGQWFWGIMIIRSDGAPVFAGRAFMYTLLAVFLWISSPLFYLIMPKRRTLPELLTGTRIIRITLRSV